MCKYDVNRRLVPGFVYIGPDGKCARDMTYTNIWIKFTDIRNPTFEVERVYHFNCALDKGRLYILFLFQLDNVILRQR